MTSNTARTVTKRDLNDLLNKKGARHLTLRNNKHGFYFNNALDPLCGSIHVGRSLQSVDMNALSVKIEAATPSPGRLAEMKKMEEQLQTILLNTDPKNRLKHQKSLLP